MIRPLLPLALAALLGVVTVKASSPDDFASRDELDHAIRQLDDPAYETRALGRLIRFVGLLWNETGSIIWVSGDPTMDALRREAREAVNAHRSVEVVRRALYADDRETRFWAVTAFDGHGKEPEPWKPLLPRLEEIAARDPDAALRTEAIHTLRTYEEGRAFLDARQESTDEQDPHALMMLLGFDTGVAERQAKWYARAAGLLLSREETVRSRWLLDVWSNIWNPSTAKRWRIEADPTLLAALRRVAAAGTPEEQARARWTIRLLEKKIARGTATDADDAPAPPDGPLPFVGP